MSLSLNRTCVKHCPQEKKLISTVKPPINCSRSRCNVLLNNDFYNYLACNDSCLESELASNGSCVSFCPKGYYYLNDTCLSTCPSYAPFLQPTILTYQTWERDWNVYRVQTYNLTSLTCVGSCSKPYTIYDFQTNTCTVQCTDTRPFILEVNFTLTCVQQCPLSENVKVHGKTEIRLGEELKTVNSIHCASYCPNDTFYFNGSCLMACPSEANHIFDGKCVRCAKFTQMIGKLAYCVNDCPQTMFENGNVCVETCPKGNAYIINRRCSICPEEAPFQLPVILGDDKCVKSCEEDNKLADFSCENCEDAVNAKCIYSFKCNKTVMINYDGKFLKYCPNGYLFFRTGCIWKTTSLIISLVSFILALTIVIYSIKVIQEYIVFVYSCFWIPVSTA
ncbi:proprotein convertase subtilisin/kexin type 5-like [Mya arenaria]|uniref:proprotein convertase subtilisin/kexin type 5-like n=1 Tax=Mya arenaria TaxID=6604 RepID=UPI0022DF8B55|nr:proprotein convertase subtilisin/kexin type 5-like [Mya arenaria]